MAEAAVRGLACAWTAAVIGAALAASGSYDTTPAAILTEIAVTLIAARAKRKKKAA